MSVANSNPNELTRKYQVGDQSYMTGNKSYGMGNAPSPHSGGGLDKAGYKARDQKAKAKRDFLYSRIKSNGF